MSYCSNIVLLVNNLIAINIYFQFKKIYSSGNVSIGLDILVAELLGLKGLSGLYTWPLLLNFDRENFDISFLKSKA